MPPVPDCALGGSRGDDGPVKSGRRDAQDPGSNSDNDSDTDSDAGVAPPKRRRGLLAPDGPVEGVGPRARVERPPFDPTEGRGIIWLSWVGTVAFTLSAVVGTIWLSTAVVCVIVSLVLFAIGTVAFISAFLRAVNRSRYEAIGMGGLYFLAGATAPARVQALLIGSLGVQTSVALGAAGIRMYTGLAFGILVPMFGLGLAGLWGARYGRFAPREPEPTTPQATRRRALEKQGIENQGIEEQASKKPPRVR